MKRFIFILFVSFSWAIGLRAFSIPLDANMFSTSTTGIAYGLGMNPAFIDDSSIKKLSFAYNKWFEGLDGANLEFRTKKSYFTINTIGVRDVELRGEIPTYKPLGTIGANWNFIRFGRGFLVKENLVLGLEMQMFNSKLYTSQTYGVSSNFGFRYSVFPSLVLGSTIKGFGYLKSDLNEEIPKEYSLGIALRIEKINTWVMMDYSNHSLIGSIFKAAIEIKKKYLKFNLGFNLMSQKVYTSGGFSFRYQEWELSYGILYQQPLSLGIPQSLQVNLYF